MNRRWEAVALDRFYKSGDIVDHFFRSNRILLGLGGIAAIGALAYIGLDALFGSSEEATLPASSLGKRGMSLEDALFRESEELTAASKVAIDTGTYYGMLAAQQFEVQGAESEVEVYDKELGVKGYIDVLLPGNIPIEIKTISSKGLDRLSRPLEAHTSQLNFYLHARRAKYGYVMYLDGQDISKTKVFRIGYQPGRLIADVQEAKNRMLEDPGRMKDKHIEWLSNTFNTSPAYLRGIRHSSGAASGWDSIKPNPEFPGGRLNSVVQVASYKIPKPPRCIPTMGLTIRQHETAIGHRTRSHGAKRVGGDHANGSRRYR